MRGPEGYRYGGRFGREGDEPAQEGVHLLQELGTVEVLAARDQVAVVVVFRLVEAAHAALAFLPEGGG